ncbi:uncharacterized protein LOC124341218 [Daphnia pulicaria]|uniref:uncharacterized protein LOC124341218 n=1 Tax=Daphnia pulicaria TaxID=35523 RepID=UPI001EEC5526|nr:uncharacterized protein LOC124341218 [Daphnia pulicaria]
MRLIALSLLAVAMLAASTKGQPSKVFDFLNYYGTELESLRQMMTMSLILPARETVTQTTTVVSTVSQSYFIPTRQTVMESTTSTSTITCTKSVAQRCSNVRQRPSSTSRPARPARPTRPTRPAPATNTSTVETVGEEEAVHNSSASTSKKRPEEPEEPELVPSIQEIVGNEEVNDILVEAANDEDEDEQFPAISPSAIQRVQSTNMPKPREGRVANPEADPQLLVVYAGNQPQDIESGFLSGSYDPVIAPFSRRYQKPYMAANKRYGDGGQQRQFLQQFFTITRKSTIFEIDIFTVTPTCSEPGRIPQCPSGKKSEKT